MRPRKLLFAAALLLAAALAPVLLAGCSENRAFGFDGEPVLADPDYVRTPPPLKLAEYVGERQVTGDDGYATGLIDYTNADQGYVAVQITAPARARVNVVYNTATGSGSDATHINASGEMTFLPLAYGPGTYSIQLMYHDGGATNKFYPLITAEVRADGLGEYAPFTVQSNDVNYGRDSECVQFSYELTKNCASDLEVAQMIYWWVSENVRYDTAKATRISANQGEDVTPNPDETLRLKTGVCYDYASLTAAMLRANGIPCRLVIGTVPGEDGDISHAWNHIWLEDVGFVAVEISVNANDWTRIDATFNAAGASQAQFIGNASNYADLYYH